MTAEGQRGFRVSPISLTELWDITKLRAETRKVVESDQFKTAIANVGDVVGYLDQPEFKTFWDADAQRVEAAVQSIGKVEG